MDLQTKHCKTFKILYLGRITVQKGIEYLINTAKIVCDYEKNVQFVIVGEGDLMQYMIDRVIELKIEDKFIFTGWLKGQEVEDAYSMSDIHILPSFSEPFGLTPLEASRKGCVNVITKQSGVAEVFNNCLKMDYWDTQEAANKIISLIRYSELREEMKEKAYEELKGFSWDKPAKKVINIYKKVLGV
ncbi:MAG: glycosyltransferase family 4 protein [Candidatus Nanoarchaeia archaeon]|nr:glycosyltransferase family 4 protein [Candidatus Nanoarchaeia archaeon]